MGTVHYLLLGIVSGAIGLLPWLVSGLRLPLQDLWATEATLQSMPIVLLPFSQYGLTLIVAVIITGSVVAGIIARLTRLFRPRFALLAIVVGVLLVQFFATVQTALAASGGLRVSLVASAYLAALVAGTMVCILIGLSVLLLVALARAPGVVFALGIAAVAVGSWVNGLMPSYDPDTSASASAAIRSARWVPAVIVGLALAWSGFGTLGRIAGAIGSLLGLWIGPTAFTAITTAGGSRVFARDPLEMARFGTQVFVSALGSRGGGLSLLLPALMIGVIGFAIRLMIRKRRSAVSGTV